ncbi:MAG: DUF4065 domain-containing protein [Hormoscilla sp. SP5CHS1]|nr:DUF4065 domain-containing protein [Hormoscilla sp. SP12CHS1]MBC6453673.1 DUF4065 domain-containing protein [Hormoscilla sp. SP5CHS1]
MAQTTANAIADYIIQFCHKHGDSIANLHLQKLVYYAQAWYLALYEKPLFDEEFQAWASGPVQPELYDRFTSYKWNPISEHPEKVELPKHVEEHILEVLDVYGRYIYYYLERMTHDEDPWRKVRRGMLMDEHSEVVISKKSMQKYYKNLLEDEDEESVFTPKVRSGSLETAKV